MRHRIHVRRACRVAVRRLFTFQIVFALISDHVVQIPCTIIPREMCVVLERLRQLSHAGTRQLLNLNAAQRALFDFVHNFVHILLRTSKRRLLTSKILFGTLELSLLLLQLPLLLPHPIPRLFDCHLKLRHLLRVLRSLLHSPKAIGELLQLVCINWLGQVHLTLRACVHGRFFCLLQSWLCRLDVIVRVQLCR